MAWRKVSMSYEVKREFIQATVKLIVEDPI